MSTDMRAQRDSARRWAVDYEQTATEMSRRVNIAAAYVADLDCDPRLRDARFECPHCYLTRVLSGDE